MNERLAFAEQLRSHLEHIYARTIPNDAEYVLGKVEEWARESSYFRQMPGAPYGVVGQTMHGWLAVPEDRLDPRDRIPPHSHPPGYDHTDDTARTGHVHPPDHD